MRPSPQTRIKRPGAGVTVDPKRLVHLREIRLLSRAQLAAKMSDGDEIPEADRWTITPDAIAKIENGYRRPKTSTLGRLCKALECEPEELFPLLPEPDRSPPVPCPDCGAPTPALHGHEPGCIHAT